MCGRMTLTREDLDEVLGELTAICDPDTAAAYRPRFNVAPTDAHIIVRTQGPAVRRTVQMARWGFPRSGGERGSLHINARSETAPFKSTFRDAYVNRRCVVPADGFFEWRRGPGPRRPLWFHRPDGRLLLMAGLYQDVPAATGAPEPATRRFLVLTTAANDVVAPVHDRMPALLMPDEVDAWLAAPAQGLLRPAAPGVLVATPVSARANSVKNDDPGCLAPPGDEDKQKQLGLFGPI